MEVYAIKTNEVLVFVSFNVLGQFEDVRRDIKEGYESIKADVTNVSSDIKGMIVVTESMNEDLKDIKMDLKESVKEDVKEGVESMKEHVKDIKKDIKEGVEECVKEGVQSMKEDVKDIKKDIKEVVKEVVKEGLKESMKEMKNIEKPEMKEDSTRMSMGNIEREDFPNPKVPALGELYLVWFYFYIKYDFFS